MAKEKAPRNKTIATPLSQGQKYLDRCISVSSPVGNIAEILDKTILGNTFSVLPCLPENSVDLVIADPPYNLTKTYNGDSFTKQKAADYGEYTRRWLSLVYPVLKPGGSIYVCCDWQTGVIIAPVLGELFRVKNRITWQREKGRGAKANWKNGMEDIWFATKGEGCTFNLDAVKIRRRVIAPYRQEGKPKDWVESEDGKFRDTCPSNFWDDITIPFWSMPENTGHPTQKPEKLAAKIILASSAPGGVVLDPFLGSGTVSTAAKKLGRRYVGIEKDEQYCLWAEQRLEMADADREIQGYAQGVFWERNSHALQKTKKNTPED